MNPQQPIGVFDSGLGGLTVARAIRDRLPRESVVYYGDTARVPYGSKSQDTILRFTREAVSFLVQHDVKCIVIACNTASALALPEIAGKVDVPVLGVIEPGARAAVAATQGGKVGVIGTAATINSEAYTRAIRAIRADVTVYAQPCPLFVPLAEEGWEDRPATSLIVEEYLAPLRTAKVDVLVLGCTHYPLLAVPIRACMGPSVALVDSASTCASELEALLASRGLLASLGDGGESFFVTDAAARFSELGARFLGRRVHAIKVVAHE